MSDIHEQFPIGKVFEHQFKVTPGIVESFKSLSGDINPVHVDSHYAKSKGFNDVIVYGNVLGLGISHLIGMALPRKEVIILKQAVDFHSPMYLDDTILIAATVKAIFESVNAVELTLVAINQGQKKVAKGTLLFKCI